MRNYRSVTTTCKLMDPERRPTSKWRSLKQILWFIIAAVIISYLSGNLYAMVQAWIFDWWLCISVVGYSCNRGNNRRWQEKVMYCCFAAITWGVWLKSSSVCFAWCSKQLSFYDKKEFSGNIGTNCTHSQTRKNIITWTTFGVKANLDFWPLLWDRWTGYTWSIHV